MGWALETRNLFKSYDGIKAITDLTLVVPEGSVFGLIGPNGAGKSTLIRMLTGIVRPDQGDAFILGRSIKEKSGSIRQRVGYVPDVPILYPSFSVGDMFRLGCRLYEGWDKRRCYELRRVFGLPTGRLVRHLSRGQKVQLALVMALSLRPRLLILDEPTAGLDPVIRRGFLQTVIEEVAERGTTVFYSTHNLNDLEQSADHIAALHRGNLLFSRSLDNLKESIHRLQVIFEGQLTAEDLKAIPGLIDFQHQGRIFTLTVSGELDAIKNQTVLRTASLVEKVDVSLEEMFVALMKAHGYSFATDYGAGGILSGQEEETRW